MHARGLADVPEGRLETGKTLVLGIGRKYISLAPVVGWILCQVRALHPTEFSRSERGSCHPHFMDKFPAPCPRLVKMGMGWYDYKPGEPAFQIKEGKGDSWEGAMAAWGRGLFLGF